jgi:hypothetical protein
MSTCPMHSLVDGVAFISIVCHPSFEFTSLHFPALLLSSFTFVHIKQLCFSFIVIFLCFKCYDI